MLLAQQVHQLRGQHAPLQARLGVGAIGGDICLEGSNQHRAAITRSGICHHPHDAVSQCRLLGSISYDCISIDVCQLWYEFTNGCGNRCM
ncbi:hypothetical protein D3C81_2085310 [compost metagenome]